MGGLGLGGQSEPQARDPHMRAGKHPKTGTTNT